MRRNRRGLTLIELLVVTSIVAVLSGAILVIFSMATRTYSQTVMQGIAQQEAAKVTDKLRDLLRLSVEVDVNRKDEIEFYLMPWNTSAKAAELLPDNDEFGSKVHVYRGNDQAQKRADGSYLWLESRDKGAGGWNDPVLLTRQVSDIELTYYYVEYDEDAADYVRIEIPEQGANRHERRLANAVRLVVTTVANPDTNAGLAPHARQVTAVTRSVVLLNNAAFMPGAAELLDPKNPDAASQPRNYLIGRGRTEVPGFVPLMDT